VDEKKDHILLAYRRSKELVSDQHLLTGTLSIVQEEEHWIKPFEDISYSKMITLLSEHSKANPSITNVLIQRMEVPAPAIALSEVELDIIRTDPTQYINATSVPQMRVIVGGKGTASPIPPVTVRACYDTLADAFGETLYLRRKYASAESSSILVESPVTGRWIPLARLALAIVRPGRAAGESWLTVATANVLKIEAPRYYLPRAWNQPGPWIERAALAERLETFRREAAKA